MNLIDKIKYYIKIDPKDNAKLRIDFDNMCTFLLSSGKSFSPFQLEKSLDKELEKAIGHSIDEKMFNAIALYINRKIEWLELEDIKEKAERQKEMKFVNEVKDPSARAERMAEVYRRREERRNNS